MNKKILLSFLSIISVLAMVSGSAFAAFTSAAGNNGNTFAAGTLKLAINTFEGTTSTPVFAVTNAKPGDVSGTQVLDLSNTGSVDAATTVLTGITVTPTGTPNLGDKLNLELWTDVNNNGVIDPGTDIQIGTTRALTDPTWTGQSLGFGLLHAGHQKVLARITFDSSADSTYQGNSVSFNLGFQANQ